MSDNDSPVLSARMTSIVAVLAFTIGVLSLVGNIANFRRIIQVVQIVDAVNTVDESQEAKAFKMAAANTNAKIDDLKGRVEAVEEAQANEAAATDPAAQPAVP